VVPFGRRGTFPSDRGLTVVLGCGLVRPLGRGRGPTVGGCRMLSSACGLGVDAAGQDDGVQDQPSGEGRDPSKGSDDILASVQHQAAVDDNTDELVVRPHGNLRITVRMTSPPTTRSWTLSRRQPSRTWPLVG